MLLQTLGFDVVVDHPHTHVVNCCNLVKGINIQQYHSFCNRYIYRSYSLCLLFCIGFNLWFITSFLDLSIVFTLLTLRERSTTIAITIVGRAITIQGAIEKKYRSNTKDEQFEAFKS